MFELKFAAEVSDLTGTWAVGVLALEYSSGITLPEESGPGISSQLFPRWMTSHACPALRSSPSEDHGIGSL